MCLETGTSNSCQYHSYSNAWDGEVHIRGKPRQKINETPPSRPAAGHAPVVPATMWSINRRIVVHVGMGKKEDCILNITKAIKVGGMAQACLASEPLSSNVSTTKNYVCVYVFVLVNSFHEMHMYLLTYWPL
jgi:hypothetical protein